MGGLTESVVKGSSNALLRWMRACKSAGNKRAVAGVAMRLVAMFGNAGRDPRVVIPLLKTVEARAYSRASEDGSRLSPRILFCICGTVFEFLSWFSTGEGVKHHPGTFDACPPLAFEKIAFEELMPWVD